MIAQKPSLFISIVSLALVLSVSGILAQKPGGIRNPMTAQQ